MEANAGGRMLEREGFRNITDSRLTSPFSLIHRNQIASSHSNFTLISLQRLADIHFLTKFGISEREANQNGSILVEVDGTVGGGRGNGCWWLDLVERRPTPMDLIQPKYCWKFIVECRIGGDSPGVGHNWKKRGTVCER